MFLAVCSYLDPDLELVTACKLRPYGGLIGIDNSRLDKYLKNSKTMRFHAVLHDACGFVHEHCRKGPGYIYAFNLPIDHYLLGHLSGLFFCTCVKWFIQSNLFKSFDI